MTGFVGWTLFAILMAAAVVHTYAGFELLGLRWDGGPFLQDMLSARKFFSYEPQRATTQIIFEGPTLLAIRLGVTDLYWLSAIWSLSLVFVAVMIVHIYHVILPEDVKNRDKFVDHFVGLRWLYGTGINIPAVLGVIAGGAILTMWLLPRYATIVAFAAATLLVVKLAMTYGVAEQFTARNHPAIISLPLGLAVLGALRWPTFVAPLLSRHAARSAVILILLASAGLGNEVITIRNWSEYVSIYRQVVANRTGFIAWADLMAELPPDQAHTF